MNNKIFANKSLESITQDEWKIILKNGAYRGRRINRLLNAFEGAPLKDLTYSNHDDRVSFKGKFAVDLNQIKKCKSTWTFSRFTYLFKKHVLWKDQAEFENNINHLAEAIYTQLHLTIEERIHNLKNSKNVSVNEVNEFLDGNAHEISQLAFRNPKKWMKFSKQIRNRLPSQDQELNDRLDQLDKIIIKHLGLDKSYIQGISKALKDSLPTEVIDIILRIRLGAYVDDVCVDIRTLISDYGLEETKILIPFLKHIDLSGMIDDYAPYIPEILLDAENAKSLILREIDDIGELVNLLPFPEKLEKLSCSMINCRLISKEELIKMETLVNLKHLILELNSFKLNYPPLHLIFKLDKLEKVRIPYGESNGQNFLSYMKKYTKKFIKKILDKEDYHREGIDQYYHDIVHFQFDIIRQLEENIKKAEELINDQTSS